MRVISFVYLLPGLVLITIVSLLAWYSAVYTVLGPVALAIIFGLIVGNTFKVSSAFQSGIIFAEKKILAFAIILLGFQLDLSVFKALGAEVLVFIVSIVLLSLCIGYMVARACKLSPTFSLLLAVGNSICGSAAIAAVVPLIKPKQFETGLSISVVNLLGTLGIFVVPWLASYFLEMNSFTNGIVIGGTLQSIGQVTAAGFSLNNETGEIALLVKMGRILMLCPMVLFLSVFMHFREGATDKKRRCPIPLFIILFVAVILINNSYVIPEQMLLTLKTLTKFLLIAAMAGFGLKINLSMIIQQGAKSLFVGSTVFMFQIVFTLSFVALFFPPYSNWFHSLFSQLELLMSWKDIFLPFM